MKKILEIIMSTIVFMIIVFGFSFNVKEVVSAYQEDLQGVTHTQLIFDEDAQKYSVEYDGAKREVAGFSGPAIFRVNEAERVMFPGKDVVCFNYWDDFWVYPKSQFEGSDIKLQAWLVVQTAEMIGVLIFGCLLIFCICIIGYFIYAFIQMEKSDYFHEPINRSDY